MYTQAEKTYYGKLMGWSIQILYCGDVKVPTQHLKNTF